MFELCRHVTFQKKWFRVLFASVLDAVEEKGESIEALLIFK
jgi:hypothetical protein